MNYTYKDESGELKVIDSSGYIVDTAKIKTKKDESKKAAVDRYIRMFKKSMSFNDGVVRKRIDKRMDPTQPRVYETFYDATSDKNSTETIKKIKSTVNFKTRMQYYFTVRVFIKGQQRHVVHARSDLFSNMKELSVYRDQAEDRMYRIISFKLTDGNASNSRIGRELLDRAEYSVKEGLVWYEGAERKNEKTILQ